MGEAEKSKTGRTEFNFSSFDIRTLHLPFYCLSASFWMTKPMLEQCILASLELEKGAADPGLLINEEKFHEICLQATQIDKGNRSTTFAKFSSLLRLNSRQIAHILVTMPRVEINNPNRAYTFLHYLHV